MNHYFQSFICTHWWTALHHSHASRQTYRVILQACGKIMIIKTRFNVRNTSWNCMCPLFFLYFIFIWLSLYRKQKHLKSLSTFNFNDASTPGGFPGRSYTQLWNFENQPSPNSTYCLSSKLQDQRSLWWQTLSAALVYAIPIRLCTKALER